ncbi:MAG: hypothetical protein U5N58_03140 [Actinomycetota bacterium]|nr:hypothetical protein [Actinomycetota bacterium]
MRHITCNMAVGQREEKVLINLATISGSTNFTATILEPEFSAEEREQVYYQLGFEKMVTRLSNEFIASGRQDLGSVLARVLRLLGQYTGIDREPDLSAGPGQKEVCKEF